MSLSRFLIIGVVALVSGVDVRGSEPRPTCGSTIRR